MRKFWRIFQLTTLAIVGFVVSGATYFLIQLWDGGILHRWQKAPFTGNLTDESIAIELAILPVIFAVLACWGIVRIFRLRLVSNEIEDTFKPVLMFYVGYARFLLIVVAGLYLLMGHGLAAAAHLVVAIVMFALFYRQHATHVRSTRTQIDLQRNSADDDDSELSN
jgi:hypothetical protein